MRVIPVFLALILLLTGCWDMKEAQNINFITALGVDYENGRFVIYAQLLDFSDIAKQEGAVETGHGEVWIGKSEGRTIDEALISLYPASNEHPGHMCERSSSPKRCWTSICPKLSTA